MTSAIVRFITYILLSIAETGILYWLCSRFLHRKEYSVKLFYIAFIIYFLFQLVTYWKNSPLFSMFLFYCLFTILLCIFCYKDSMRIRVLVAYLYVQLNYACKLLSALLVHLLLGELFPSQPDKLVQSPAAQLTACLLFYFFTLFFILCRNIRKLSKNSLYGGISFLIPLLLLFLTIHSFSARTDMPLYYLEISGILLGSSTLLFYLIDGYMVIDEESQKNILAEKIMQMQISYYQKVEDSQKELVSIRHDLKKHLQAIVSLLQDQQYEEAVNYIETVYESANRMKTPLSGGNNMVNILINNAQQRATELNIPFKANIMVPSKLPIDNTDLCIILGNLLDNALEGNIRITDKNMDRFIQTDIRIQKAFLFIRITNAFDGTYKINGKHYASVKTDAKFHGIGLSNVTAVLEKYHGDMKITQKDQTFIVTIMIPLENISSNLNY